MAQPRKPREPGKHETNPRDADGNREHTLRSMHRRAVEGLSLRAFARAAVRYSGDSEALLLRKEAARRWLHNKSVNASKPPLGIGRTNGKRKSKGNATTKRAG